MNWKLGLLFPLTLSACASTTDAGAQASATNAARGPSTAQRAEWLRCSTVGSAGDSNGFLSTFELVCHATLPVAPLPAMTIDLSATRFSGGGSSATLQPGVDTVIGSFDGGTFPLTLHASFQWSWPDGAPIPIGLEQMTRIEGDLHIDRGGDPAAIWLAPYDIWPITVELQSAVGELDFSNNRLSLVAPSTFTDGNPSRDLQETQRLASGTTTFYLPVSADAAALTGDVVTGGSSSTSHHAFTIDHAGSYIADDDGLHAAPTTTPAPAPSAPPAVASCPSYSFDATSLAAITAPEALRCWVDAGTLFCCTPQIPAGFPLQVTGASTSILAGTRLANPNFADTPGTAVAVVKDLVAGDFPLNLDLVFAVALQPALSSDTLHLRLPAPLATVDAATPAQPLIVRLPFQLWPLSLDNSGDATVLLQAANSYTLGDYVNIGNLLSPNFVLQAQPAQASLYYLPVSTDTLAAQLTADGVTWTPVTLTAPGRYAITPTTLTNE